MSLGQRIREARKNKKITQNELGEMIGVASTSITGYEKDRNYPDKGKLALIMEILDIDANYLFQDEMKNRPDNTITILSPREEEIIKIYRNLDYFGKKHVDAVIDIEKDREKGSRLEYDVKISNLDEQMEDLADVYLFFDDDLIQLKKEDEEQNAQ